MVSAKGKCKLLIVFESRDRIIVVTA